jgi:hypothetical protein
MNVLLVALVSFLLILPGQQCIAQERQFPQSPGISPRLPQDPLKTVEDKQRRLAETARITLSEAVRIVEKAIPGKAVEAVLDEDQGHIVYKVTVVDTNKKLHSIQISAVDGKIVEPKK